MLNLIVFDSKERPPAGGYEPNELPLLHSAIFCSTKVLHLLELTNVLMLFFYFPKMTVSTFKFITDCRKKHNYLIANPIKFPIP